MNAAMINTRAEQIQASFIAFHRSNPIVWDLFCRFTFEAIRSGHPHYSSDCIFNRIRWHTDIETQSDNDPVKLNNNFRAYYARMFHEKYPEHAGFFRNRKLTSEEQCSHENNMQVFDSGPPGPETALRETLRHLH